MKALLLEFSQEILTSDKYNVPNMFQDGDLTIRTGYLFFLSPGETFACAGPEQPFQRLSDQRGSRLRLAAAGASCRPAMVGLWPGSCLQSVDLSGTLSGQRRKIAGGDCHKRFNRLYS